MKIGFKIQGKLYTACGIQPSFNGQYMWSTRYSKQKKCSLCEDFGGKVDSTDMSPEYTAAREFEEESDGGWLSYKQNRGCPKYTAVDAITDLTDHIKKHGKMILVNHSNYVLFEVPFPDEFFFEGSMLVIDQHSKDVRKLLWSPTPIVNYKLHPRLKGRW